MTSAVSYCAMIVRILKVVRAYIFLALNSRDIDITQYNFENGSGSVAEWLACWTQIAVATLSGNSLSKLFTPVVPLSTKHWYQSS